MPYEWERFIDTIRADNTAGAAELARMAAIAVLEWIDQTLSMPPHAWKKAMLAFAPELYLAQPAMAPLFNLANDISMTLFSGIIGENGLQRPQELRRELLAMPIAQVLRSRTSDAD